MKKFTLERTTGPRARNHARLLRWKGYGNTETTTTITNHQTTTLPLSGSSTDVKKFILKFIYYFELTYPKYVPKITNHTAVQSNKPSLQ